MRKGVSPHKAPIRVVIKDNLGADAPGASAPRACARPPWEGLVALRGKRLAPRACAHKPTPINPL